MMLEDGLSKQNNLFWLVMVSDAFDPSPIIHQPSQLCQPCVSLCHPLKRCTPFIYRHCVSVSAFLAKFFII